MRTQRSVVNFGRKKVAFLTSRKGKQVAVAYKPCRSVPTSQEWKQLAERLSFDAPEAQ